MGSWGILLSVLHILFWLSIHMLITFIMFLINKLFRRLKVLRTGVLPTTCLYRFSALTALLKP